MPPGVTTLGAIRTAVRQRADMVNTQFVTDSEVNGYINASYYELYDLLVEKFGNNIYVAGWSTITTDGTNDTFALPSDFYKLLAVDLAINASQSQFVDVPRFNLQDRNRYAPYNNTNLAGRANISYLISGSNIWLTPKPTSGLSLRILYVPRLTALVNDSDTVDGVSGWEEYVITDAAIKCMQKEESDVSVLMAQKAALINRIESAAENRDAGNPQTTSISQGGLVPGADPYGGGWGW